MNATENAGCRRVPFLLKPALAVMNRLKYPQKFALISLLFALPLVFVMYLLIREINNQIQFAQKEVQGDKYLRPLRQLYEHTAQSHLLAHSYAGGRVAVRPKLIHAQTEIDEDFVALQAVEEELGQVLRTDFKYQALRENWRFLREKLLQLEAVDCEGLHHQLLADIRALAAHVGDTSNLILDPDLDSYYLMDTVLLKLPQSHELLVQARLVGRKSLAPSPLGRGLETTPQHVGAPAAALTPEQRAEFIRLAGLLRSNVEETRHGMEVAFRENPAANLKTSLELALRRHLAETDAFLRTLDNDIIKGKAAGTTADDYDELAEKSQQASYDLWDRSIRELDGLLQARLEGFAEKRQLVVVLTVLALLLVAYLWVAFYVGVMRTVSRLREASERMLGGSLDHVVALETRDELGQVATSFNNIAGRLREEWQQARDESARAHAATELLRKNQEELHRAKEAAETANRAKSVFLATMSHEIRTPLNAVLGMASLLQDTELTAQQQEFAGVIRTSGEALLGVINDILDFSKIEAGHLELEREPLDLRGCIEGALDVVAVRGAEKGLELACQIGPDVPTWIVGDVTRLRQILINLLSNAVKFTEKGEVVLTVLAAPTSDGSHEVTFAVRDTGIGISPDRIARLFRSFSQVDASTTRKYGGTGLGLVISKRIVEMMGGRMEVTSEPGQGSTFQFSIVAASAPTPAFDGVNHLEDLPDPATKRLLIVDDNDTNRRIVTLLTQKWGFKTRDTGSPLEALRWLESGEHFDLGILDIAMPEMDGLTLATTIRQRFAAAEWHGRETVPQQGVGAGSPDPATGRHGRETVPQPGHCMPLVAFTSLTRKEALGDRSEFDAFVTKPLKPSHLLDVLITLFAGQAVQRGERSKKHEFDTGLGQRLPLRILVAEDVPVNQQMMRVMLSRLGYVADFADNGREALRAVQRRQYDLVFMDMQMPEMDGVECSREIVRLYPALSPSEGEGRVAQWRPIIVALTANVTAEDESACKAAGMNDFLTKPIKPLELCKCLERWGEAVRQKDNAGQKPGFSEKPGFSSPCHPVTLSPCQPKDVKLIDEAVLADLRDLDAGEPGLLQSFIDSFGRAVPEHVALMHQALAIGDGEQLRKIAHRLKGTAANVGACGVADQCRVLEELARSGRLADGPALIGELEQRYQRTAALFVEMAVGQPQAIAE